MKRTITISDPRVLEYIDRYKEQHYLRHTAQDDSDAVEELLLEKLNLPVLDGGRYDGYPEEYRERCIIRDRNMRKIRIEGDM
ncbi:MAG: hypothetical protein IJ383_00200 [Bacteroidales bacterium]|nr:hypothetical protein [Bacteroidales bacterium]